MKRLAKTVSVLAAIAYLLTFCSPALAQPDEEKNFLLMYFKEEELVVQSATRSSKPISRTAENISVVTAADIELMNAHTVAEVLNTVPGVVVWMTGGPGQIAQAYIQGSDTKHVTVIIDGIILNNVANNIADLGILPVQNIEKIEIIKGPASSAWGSALGGVINIITKSGTKDNSGGMVSASYGTRNTIDSRAEARGKQNGFGYYLSAGNLQSDGLTLYSDVRENNTYAKFSYDLSDHTDILAAVGYMNTTRNTGLDPLFDLSYENSLEILHATMALNSTLRKNLDLNVSLRTLRQDFISTNHQLSTGAFLQESRAVDEGYGASAKLTWKSPSQTIVAGADYDDKRLKWNNLANGEQGIKKSAFYANDTLTFNKLSVTPGIRYDSTNTNGDMASPSLGLTYGIANSTILRASAARGFSIPTLAETFGDGIYFTANPDLKMETVIAYQVGAETTAVKSLWLKLSAFRNDIDDAITVDTSSATTILLVNGGSQRRQGIEFAMKTVPVYNTSLSAGAEYVDAVDAATGQRLHNIPTQVYDLALRYDDTRSLKALLQGRYVDWNADPSYNGKYDSFIFDLTMTKKMSVRKYSSLEVFAAAHNIFNGSQYVLDVYKNPERWYEAGIRCKF